MKSQMISMDLFVAVTILLIIIAGLTIVVHEFNVNQEQMVENRDMQLKGEAAINSLVYSPGEFNQGGG